MFLQLNHQKLDVFIAAKSFTFECYKFTKMLPSEEKFNMVQQVRRASLSVYLNIAEGCSRKSVVERKRFYEIARGSVIEVDTAFDIAFSLGYTSKEKLADLGTLLVRSFQLISKMIS